MKLKSSAKHKIEKNHKYVPINTLTPMLQSVLIRSHSSISQLCINWHQRVITCYLTTEKKSNNFKKYLQRNKNENSTYPNL